MIATSRHNRIEPNQIESKKRTTHHTTLNELVHSLNAEYRHDGEYHAQCPHCGKEVKRGQTHMSFGKSGYFCQRCKEGGSLSKLATILDLGIAVEWTDPPKPPKDKTRLSDRIDIDAFVDRLGNYETALRKLQLSKPYATLPIMQKYRVVYGCMPGQKTPRIFFPIVETGQDVGLRGRLSPDFVRSEWMIENDIHPDKYMFARGSKTPFFNIDSVQDAAVVVLIENNLDSMVIPEKYPTINGMTCTSISPTTGAGTKPSRNPQVVNALRGKVVVLWFDNDAAGQRATQQWEQALKGVAAAVVSFEYAAADSEKCDIGDYLTRDYEQGTDRVGDFLRAYTAPHSPANDYVFLQGLPDILRTALNTARDASGGLIPKQNAGAMVYDVWTDLNRHGWTTPYHPMTVDDLVRGAEKILNRQLDRKTAWIGLNMLVDIGIVVINSNFFTILSTVDSLPEKNGINSAGRNPNFYTLVPKTKAIENLRTFIKACCFVGSYIEDGLIDKDDLKPIYKEYGLLGTIIQCSAIPTKPRHKERLATYANHITQEALETAHSTPIPTEHPISGQALPFASYEAIDPITGDTKKITANSAYIAALHVAHTPIINPDDLGMKNHTTNNKARSLYGVSAPTYRLIKDQNQVHTAPLYRELEIKQVDNVMGQIYAFCKSIIAERGGLFGMQLIFRSREYPYTIPNHPTIPIHGKSKRDLNSIVDSYLRGDCRVYLQIRIGTKEWFEVPEQPLVAMTKDHPMKIRLATA